MHCDACGTENRSGSRFCDHCGSQLALPCPSCGESNRADALFCATCGTSLRDETPAATDEPAAERRQVSVLFADLVGFTTFAEGRDPEHVRHLQQRYFDAASEAIARHGGTVEKFIGDAVMAVWGTPVAHEDDAQRAVRAGLELLSAVQGLGHDLQARAGVVTAEAAVSMGASNQAMVAGDMVNIAARLQASAEPGQVLADHATVQAAEGVIGFEQVPDRELKGKAVPMRAWRATRVVSTRSTDFVAPPFVGRADELRHLKDLLHAVGRDRRSRLVSITGPAGIGKSRMVEELGTYADGVTEQIYWHSGRSPSYGEGLAFWAVGEMVRRRAGLAEGDDEEATRRQLATTLEEFVADADERGWIERSLLALLGVGEVKGSESLFPPWRTFFERIAERGSVVLIFEDLQWADTGTLDFVDHLLDWSRAQPILVITLARPELLEARPGWGTVRSSATALALDPLPDADMRALLEGLLPGLPATQVATILQRAEGVPLYAVEMVRSLLADGRIERRGEAYAPSADLGSLPIPASLRSLIASRLDALAANDRALLQQAAVLGLAFDADALAAVSATDPAELAPRLTSFVRRQLLQIEADPRSPERGQFRFVQSLIREVAYDTLALRDRRSRHLAAARHLEAAGSDEAAGALASHYLAAYHASTEGPEADAVAAQARVSLRAAADRAAALGAHAQAVANLEHALSITSDPGERAELLVRAATSAAIGAVAGADDFGRQAVDAYREIGDRAGSLRATALLGDVLLDQGRVPEAGAVLAEAVASLSDAADWGEPEASVLAMHSRALMRLDDHDGAVDAADQALKIAERLRLDPVIAAALGNKGGAMSQAGRAEEAIALLEGAIRIANRSGMSHLELRARLNLGITRSDNEPLPAIEAHAAAADLARRVGDVVHFVASLGIAADGLASVGTPESWTRMLALVEEAEPLASADRDLIGLLETRMLPRLLRGEDVSAELELMDRYDAQSTDPRVKNGAPVARARWHFVSDRWPEAAAAARTATDNDVWVAAWVGQFLVLDAVRRNDLAGIRAAVDLVDRVPTHGAWPGALRMRMQAILAAVEGRTDEAVTGFAEAFAVYRDLGTLLDLAYAGIDVATALPSDPRVRPLIAEARDVLVALEAKPLIAMLDRAVADEGQPASGPHPPVADGARTPSASA